MNDPRAGTGNTENILKRRTSKNPKSRRVNEMPLKTEDIKY